MCPYLRESICRNYCIAYLGYLMEPSCYEEDHLCLTGLHTTCVWYLSENKPETDRGDLCTASMVSIA